MTQLELAEKMGVVVLSVLNELETETAIVMLGIGLACQGIVLLSKKE